MRETCARVLAAALMTGAIGFALAMPAIFETAHKAAGRSLTAPPSSLRRSVHVVASAPSLSARDGRLERTQPTRRGSFLPDSRSGSNRDGSTPESSRHSSRAGRSERDPKPAPKPAPKPTPAPAPATRELADTTPPAAVSPPAPSQPPASPGGKGKGKKKAKQHDKSKGKPAESPQPPVAATTPQPANESPATESEKDHGNDKDKDKEKDKGKSDDKRRDG
jgi:hypothetical protein